MNRPSILTALGVCVWVLFATSIIWVFNIGDVGPIAGAQFLDKGLICENEACANNKPVSIPFYTSIKQTTEIEKHWLRFQINVEQKPSELYAIFLPHFADDVFIKFNNTALFGQPIGNKQPRRMWNKPLLVSIPPALIEQGSNLLEIELSGYPQEGLILDGIHYGPYDVLISHYS